MKKNKVKEKLKKGLLVPVPEINHIFSPKVVEIIALAGYECVWIDMEHSVLTHERLADMTAAARPAGIDVIVRIAKGGYTSVIKTLEAGATGLVLPHCMSEAEAKDFVRMAKFAPMGLRGMGCGADSGYGSADVFAFIKQANEETLLIAQIEDREAVDDIEGIASVEGIDCLFIGPNDLSQSYGVPGQTDHPLVLDAIERIAGAGRKCGTAWGIRVFSAREAGEMLRRGAQFLNITSDNDNLIQGYRQALEDVKAQFKK
jgi:4-hydroxy-2-oxoheptanedioate aldolase